MDFVTPNSCRHCWKTLIFWAVEGQFVLVALLAEISHLADLTSSASMLLGELCQKADLLYVQSFTRHVLLLFWLYTKSAEVHI